MDVITLPEDLEIPLKDQDIQLFDYQINEARLKNKIDLRKNTISFLLEGIKEVATNYKPISIENSHFLIMKSGHCLMTENVSKSNHMYRSILLFFSDKILFDFIEKHKISIQKTSSYKTIEVFKYNDFILSFVESLSEIQNLSIESQKKMLRVKFEEIMLYLMEINGAYFFSFLTKNKSDHSRVFLKVIENNALNRLTIRELAFLSNMSVSTFKREFKKQFNESPIKWFQDKRLMHAATLLKNESKRPSDIFEDVGYESLSSFVQAFKVKFGVTPKKYQLDS